MLKNGYIVADVIADMWQRELEKLSKDQDCKKVFLKGNNAYLAGEIHHQTNLADTLKEISNLEKMGFMKVG